MATEVLPQALGPVYGPALPSTGAPSRRQGAQSATFQGRTWEVLQNGATLLVWLISEVVHTILHLLEQLVTYFCPNDPQLVARYGNGIHNKDNCCYAISTVQALRFVPELLRHLPAAPVTPNVASARRSLTKLHNLIHNQQKPVAFSDIDAFRKQMIQEGFLPPNVSHTNKEDAEQFCLFVLRKIGFPKFSIKTEVLHELGIEVPALKEEKIERHRAMYLSLASVSHNTRLQDLITSRVVTEEVEREKVRSAMQNRYSEKEMQKLNSLAEIEPVQTVQSIHLMEENLPAAFPIVLTRYSFDAATQRTTKNKTAITPSEVIEFPLHGQPSKKARYELKAIILHSGSTPHDGHYSTFVPHRSESQNRAGYVEFNNSNVQLHEDSSLPMHGYRQSLDETIAQNGYIYFYQFSQFI